MAPKGTARAIANKVISPGLGGTVVSGVIKTIGSGADTTPSTKGSEADTTPHKKGSGAGQPKPETQPETRVPQQPKPETQPETPVPQQPKPESRKERWSDVRQRLGFSRRQSVTSDPKLLAAYNAYKERQQTAEETEYSQELIEWAGPALGVARAATARAAGAAGAKKALPNVYKFGKKAIERLKKLFKGGSKLAGTAALIAALNRLSGGLTSGGLTSGGSDGSISPPGSMTQLHTASPSSGISPSPIRESESPATKARKTIENVARPKLKNLRNALGNKQGEIEKKIKE